MAAMSRRDDRHEDFEIPSIVPERDELVSHRGRPRGNSLPEPVVHDVAAGTSGGVIFMLTLLFLGTLATGATAYVFYQQGQQALDSLDDARNRIMALESTLSAVGEDAEQTTLGIIQRVETNFSEIDKLWAARNTLRGEVAELKSAAQSQKELLASLETAVANHGKMLNENSAAVDNIRSRVDNIASNLSSLENAGRQLQSLNDEVNTLARELDSLQGDLSDRVAANEQDIESINVYRLQLNQTIPQLEQSIRQVQERLGQ